MVWIVYLASVRKKSKQATKKKKLKGLKEGRESIYSYWNHRIFSKDLIFQDLGLFNWWMKSNVLV